MKALAFKPEDRACDTLHTALTRTPVIKWLLNTGVHKLRTDLISVLTVKAEDIANTTVYFYMGLSFMDKPAASVIGKVKGDAIN